MEPLEIEFSQNWNNKLDCNAFTTIRMWNPAKHIPGRQVVIKLKGEVHSEGVIHAVKQMNIEQINDYMAYLDTGHNAEYTKKILKNMYTKKYSANWDIMVLALILIVKK